jgi:hypothetical protein
LIKIVATCLLALAVSGSASAQTSNSVLTVGDVPTWSGGTGTLTAYCGWNGNCDHGSVSDSNCNGNDKTASEVAQCKLDYWRKEVERDSKALEQAQSALDHARDRVRAFEQELRK